MSFTLQTQELLSDVPFSVEEEPKDNPLTREHGWKEVARGLTRILVGYGVFFLMAFAAALLVAWLVLQGVTGAAAGPDQALNIFTVLVVGGCILGLLGLYAYWLILSGTWACALYAPDRQGARWFMFATIVCLVMGPVVNVITSFASAPTPAEMKELRQQHPQKTSGRWSQLQLPATLHQRMNTANLIGSTLSMATTVFFVLFLRSIGQCMGFPTFCRLNELYLLLNCILIGYTLHLAFSLGWEETPPLLLLGLGLCWFASGVGYILLVIGARIVVHAGMLSVRSPLEEGGSEVKGPQSGLLTSDL